MVVVLMDLLDKCIGYFQKIENRKKEKWKYQGVKEFHMLARISCYCKIMVFSNFKLGDTYCQSSKGGK